MSQNTPEEKPGEGAQTPSNSPSVKLVIALVALAPVVAASVALLAIATTTTEGIARQLGTTMVQTGTRRAADEVRSYLECAVRVADLYADRVRRGILPVHGSLEAWELPMLEDLDAWPEVASICLGTDEGTSTWALRGRKGLEVGRGLGPGEGQTTEFPVGAGKAVGTEPIRVYAYDPRKRPWYGAGSTLSGSKASTGTFTPIYFWFGDQGAANVTGVGYVVPAVNPQGQSVGVIVVDVTLGALSDFLKRLDIANTGAIFLVDERNQIVAASEGGVNSESGERLRLELSTSPAAKAAAELIGPPRVGGGVGKAEIEGSHREPLSQRIEYRLANGSLAFARVESMHIAPFAGVNWRCVAVVPEAAFLGEAHAMQRKALWMASGCVLGALVLGWLLSRRLSGPLTKLAAHVQALGKGNFDARINLTQARELHMVSDELNKASAGLKQRMEMQNALDVAMQVQQSLLPLSDPVDDRLDVVGRAQYCDATGGDYYDFIDVPHIRMSRADSAGGCMFIAIGDVQGHGVGAALLMATARAALRAQALDQGRLDALMDRVNKVLATDNRHNRFMTMVLAQLQVDSRGQGSVQWASAGHEPPIVFDPHTGEFTELEGGGVPLGMFAEHVYEQYSVDALKPGCIVLLGTDGIWEMQSPTGALFGKQRMLELVRLHSTRCAKDIADALETSLSAWRAGRAAEDDVTFVLVKVL